MRKYTKMSPHLRAMISRVKYYRRLKAEKLRLRRKFRNFSYFIYAYKQVMRKFYLRNLRFHKTLMSQFDEINISKKYEHRKLLKAKSDGLFLYSAIRRHELDEFDPEDEEKHIRLKKYPSEGYIYISDKMTIPVVNVMSIITSQDAWLWRLKGVFSNSIRTLTKNKVYKTPRYTRLVKIGGFNRTNFIRENYETLYRMDRIKFPIVTYKMLAKAIRMFKKYNYIFRKLSGLLIKRRKWSKIFLNKSFWQYQRLLKIKILNKIKINIHKTYNNFYITAVRNNKEVLLSYSAGCSGLTGSKRISPFSAEKVARKFINKFFEKYPKFMNIDLNIKSSRIDGVIRNIVNILSKTKKIQYSKIFKRRILLRLIINKLLITKPRSHNGVRKRHTRRV